MDPQQQTILIVDDEELIRNLIVTFLSRLGYLCVAAGDGVDALDKMKEQKIDAIITDIGMPRMDGIFLTREISKQQPGLPVMVMTAFDEEYSVGTAISVGAREFIKKPISLEECAIRLHKMIRESEPLADVKVEKSREEEDVDKDIHLLAKELETALEKE